MGDRWPEAARPDGYGAAGILRRARRTRGALFTGEGGQKPHAQAATGRRVF